MNERLYWYWLSKLPDISSQSYQRLIEIFECPSQIYKYRNNSKLWHPFDETIDNNFLNQVKEKVDFRKLENELFSLSEKGIYFSSIEDNDFPEKLKVLDDRPHFIYYKGRLPRADLPSIAVIGARECSEYGLQVALYFSKQLAKENIQIISGMARGIDGKSHRGALEVDGLTFAVLGCGVDECYPRSNMDIFKKIPEKGGIISEYCPGKRGLAYRFPLRNRIISALSDGILVVEAGEKSGTLITVTYGLEQGKDIYAVPGKITDRLSQGCNKLIKEGAFLANNPEDIIKDMMVKYPLANLSYTESDGQLSFEKKLKPLASDEKMVYSVLSLEPKHVEDIQNATKLPINRLLKALVSLELQDYVSKPTKDYFVKNMF